MLNLPLVVAVSFLGFRFSLVQDCNGFFSVISNNSQCNLTQNQLWDTDHNFQHSARTHACTHAHAQRMHSLTHAQRNIVKINMIWTHEMHLTCLKGKTWWLLKETLTPACHKATIQQTIRLLASKHTLQLCAGELWGCKHCTITTDESTYIASNNLNAKFPHAATDTW